MHIIKAKNELRNIIKDKKSHLSSEDKNHLSNQIFLQIEQLPQFQSSKTILAYWSMSDEVQTHQFIERWQHCKKFILPLVKGNDLELREFTGTESLTAGERFGILEPHTGELVNISTVDMIIVPGVAFDKKGNRLGRGKAYYDKLLQLTNAYKVGVCFEIQLVNQVPVESTDVPMDVVIWG